MPSKLTGMLASARAVVATAKPGTELASVVQSCGLVVPPEDPAALAQAVSCRCIQRGKRATALPDAGAGTPGAMAYDLVGAKNHALLKHQSYRGNVTIE